MRGRRQRRLVFLVIGLLSIAAATAGGVAGAGITVDLDGRLIASVEASRYNCHDLDYPRLHCYVTEKALDAAIARYGIGPLSAESANGIAYVRVWQDASFQGSTVLLSNDYPSLGAIGWNDRITSFKALNLQHGEFYEHDGYAGFVYGFCCNSQVANVGSFYNDKFSSVKNLT